MELVRRRWWNGHYGRLARRDVVIFIDGDTWRVEAWEGGREGRVRAWAPPDESIRRRGAGLASAASDAMVAAASAGGFHPV